MSCFSYCYMCLLSSVSLVAKPSDNVSSTEAPEARKAVDEGGERDIGMREQLVDSLQSTCSLGDDNLDDDIITLTDTVISKATTRK